MAIAYGARQAASNTFVDKAYPGHLLVAQA